MGYIRDLSDANPVLIQHKMSGKSCYKNMKAIGEKQMPKRRYAENTLVPPGESKEDITNLLRQWGVGGIRWSEDFENNGVMLEFVWTHNSIPYHARMTVRLPDDRALEKEARHKRSGKVLPDKLKKLKATRGWREHRVLQIFLKGAFEAIENGIITPEQLFLPWLVGRDGRTVSEAIGPRLPEILENSATALLPPASVREQ
jgi:hypothetical protein